MVVEEDDTLSKKHGFFGSMAAFCLPIRLNSSCFHLTWKNFVEDGFKMGVSQNCGPCIWVFPKIGYPKMDGL